MTPDRGARHRQLSAELASWSDEHLRDRLAAAPPLAGIGGTARTLDVAGGPVFVKLIPLSDRERPDRTDNVFELPTWYQWGVGSAGFGAGRELAAQQSAAGWALAGQPNFVHLHHQRILTDAASLLATYAEPVEDMVAFWRGGSSVRARLEAVAAASTAVVLVLEHVPYTVLEWLTAELADDDAITLVEHELIQLARFLRDHGLRHFDAHFRNLLTDGRQVYVCDFGLASSSSFELDEAERTLLGQTENHDLAYVVTEFVNTLVRLTVDTADRQDYLRRCARDGSAPAMRPALSQVVRRYAPVAVVLNDFYWQLHAGQVRTPYPAAAVDHALTATGLLP